MCISQDTALFLCSLSEENSLHFCMFVLFPLFAFFVFLNPLLSNFYQHYSTKTVITMIKIKLHVAKYSGQLPVFISLYLSSDLVQLTSLFSSMTGGFLSVSSAFSFTPPPFST